MQTNDTTAGNNRRYSVFAAMLLAPTFSGALSRDVARNWRGIGLRLLLLVLAITWLAVLIKLKVSFGRFVRDELPPAIQDVPPVTIKDGVVSTPATQPHELRDHKSGELWGVIDTTGEITSLDQTDAFLLLTRNKVHFRNPSRGEVREHDLSQVKSFYVDQARITGWAHNANRWLLPVLFPVMLVLSLIWRVIMAVVYGLIGLIFNSAFNARLSFDALMRLSALAVVTPLLLDTILNLIGVSGGCAWTIVSFVIAIVYLGVAVRANQLPPDPYQGGYGPGGGYGQYPSGQFPQQPGFSPAPSGFPTAPAPPPPGMPPPTSSAPPQRW